MKVNTHVTVDDGVSFEKWYRAADVACGQVAGLGIDDLPDGPSRDSYDDGVSAYDYAMEQLAGVGFPF